MRTSYKTRVTNETNITCDLNLDGTGQCDITTGIGFMDHMLELFTFYSKIDLKMNITGDLDIDGHHTIEDVGLLLGDCFKEALGDKKGIARYGMSLLPMDECLSRAVIDFSGRPYLVFDCDFIRSDIGQLDVQNIKEFFKSFSNTSMSTLHLSLLYGENDHHKAEALFKGFGQCIRMAKTIEGDTLPSTKGVL